MEKIFKYDPEVASDVVLKIEETFDNEIKEYYSNLNYRKARQVYEAGYMQALVDYGVLQKPVKK